MNLVRLAQHLGLPDEALRVAREVLKSAPTSATALRAQLESVLRS
jgi:hypothetical protein